MPKSSSRSTTVSAKREFYLAVATHGGARVLSKVASAPFERMKICLQVAAPPCVPAAPAGVRSLAMVVDTVSTQGAVSLWRGSGVHVLGACVGGVMRLGMLRTSQMWAMPGGDQRYQGLGAFSRRCTFLYAAGAAALFAAYPLDTAYTCLAADRSARRRYRGFFHFSREVVRERGITSLYRGLPLCLLTAIPFVIVATGAHDVMAPSFLSQSGRPPRLVQSWKANHPETKPDDLAKILKDGALAHLFPWNLLLGTTCGFIAQSVTYPLDTIRRRWQHVCTQPTETQVVTSIRGCAETLHRDGGIRAFYAGFGFNTAKLFPELLVLCGVYQFVFKSGSWV